MRCLQQKRAATLCTPSATCFPVFECVCLTPGELCLWGSVGLSAPKPFVLPFSGFQIPCNGVPDLVPLCVPLRCKKTSSSMESAFLPPPADPFRSPTFHACNTCLDSFSEVVSVWTLASGSMLSLLLESDTR